MRSRGISDAVRSDPAITRQHRVVTRSQLIRLDISQSSIDAHIAAGRWARWDDDVIVLHNGDLTRRQLMWAAVLDAGPPAALCSHTALELHGFEAFATEADRVHLIIPRGAKLGLSARSPDIVHHESRRLRAADQVQCEGLPCTRPALAAIDAASWQPWPRFACAQLAAVVQQGICTVDDLGRTLPAVGAVRHIAHMRLAVQDIRGGSDALSEIDLVRLCDRFELRRPDQQVRRRDRDGRYRYLDALWRLPDGRTIVLEVDGSHHMDARMWQDDLRRERDIVISGKSVLRATSTEVRLDQNRIALDLEAAGVPKSCQNHITS